MWINSPLGKWEQEVRVNKALRGAERMRAQEEVGDAGGAARVGSSLDAAGVSLQLLVARAGGAVEVIQAWLATSAAPRG